MDVQIFISGRHKEVQLAGFAEIERVLPATVPNPHETDTPRPDQTKTRNDLIYHSW